MLWEEMIKDERADAKLEDRIEMVLEFLEELGTVPEELRSQIEAEKDLDILKQYEKLAARAESIEQFKEKIHS